MDSAPAASTERLRNERRFRAKFIYQQQQFKAQRVRLARSLAQPGKSSRAVLVPKWLTNPENHCQNLPRPPYSLPGEMDRLTKLLFPKNPRMVRYRKLQVLYIAVFLTVAICAAVGVMIFLLNQMGVK